MPNLLLLLISFLISIPTESETVDILDQDLSELLMPSSDFLGFIGEDKQRIYMQFDSLWKDADQKNLYHLKGHSTVKGNRCDFKGLLIIEGFSEDEGLPRELDQKSPNPEWQSAGKIKGRYLFSENPEQKHVGVFSGSFWCTYLLKRDGDLSSNEVNRSSDDFRDHQYEGAWRPYGEENSRVCNWGIARIPNSGDLDIGAAEFSANPKYREQGW